MCLPQSHEARPLSVRCSLGWRFSLADEVGHHQEPDVVVGGHPAQPGVGLDVGPDQFLAGAGGEKPEQFRQLVGPAGAGQLGDVALGHGADVVGEPGSPVAGVEADRFGVATGDDPLEIVDGAERAGGPVAEALRVAEGDVDEPVPAAAGFALGERPQLQEGGPAGERFGDGRDGEEVGRSVEQELAGAGVVVDDGLDGPDERIATPLDLVERPGELPQPGERRRVPTGGLQRRLVVEADQRASPAEDVTDERGLAGLAGAGDDDDPERRQRLFDHRFQTPGPLPCRKAVRHFVVILLDISSARW